MNIGWDDIFIPIGLLVFMLITLVTLTAWENTSKCTYYCHSNCKEWKVEYESMLYSCDSGVLVNETRQATPLDKVSYPFQFVG